MVHLSFLDSLLIVFYFAAVVFIGFRAARRGKSNIDEYLLAGRSLSLPIFVATLVSTWYGGVLGVGEFSYKFGISNWIVFGAPYYIFAFLFALFLAKRVRATGLYTVPDKLFETYGRKTSLLGSFLTLLLVSPAPYILMLGVLMQLIFGWPLFVCIIVSTFLSIIYLYKGGLHSDVWTNTLEFILMFAGFAIILPFSYLTFGGFDFIKANVPPLHLTWNGSNSVQYVIVWFFIALWTLVDPSFHQRCYAAKSGKIARTGILISILFWCAFDFMTSVAGLYARAAIPDLQQPMFSYPMLAEITLPSLAKGLFYIGMLATIMSTLGSFAFLSAVTIGKDMVWRLKGGDEKKIDFYTKAGLIVTAIMSIFVAVLIPSVVKLWYTIGTVCIPGLLVPLMSSYFDKLRVPSRYAFASMLFGWLVSVASLLYGVMNSINGSPNYLFGIEPMYPGLAASLVIWSAGRLSSRPD
jgi:SSS family solute:Na+ symporter